MLTAMPCSRFCAARSLPACGLRGQLQQNQQSGDTTQMMRRAPPLERGDRHGLPQRAQKRRRGGGGRRQRRPYDLGVLDHVALQRQFEYQPGWQLRQEWPYLYRVGIECQTITQIVIRHSHGAAVGAPPHHALAALAMIATAAPLCRRFIRKQVALGGVFAR